MTVDLYDRMPGRATLLVRAMDGILGTHRQHLPSLVLTAAETLAIREDAILGPARRACGAGDPS
jgi:hypothetical protein